MFDNILNIQLYVTSAPAGDGHDGLSLALALELLYNKSRRDVVTGLRTQCRPGRPDWHTVLADIHERSSYKVSVFYCGAPQAADIIQPICDQFDFLFKKEIF